MPHSLGGTTDNMESNRHGNYAPFMLHVDGMDVSSNNSKIGFEQFQVSKR